MRVWISQPLEGKAWDQIKLERAPTTSMLKAEGHTILEIPVSEGNNGKLWCLGQIFQIIF